MASEPTTPTGLPPAFASLGDELAQAKLDFERSIERRIRMREDLAEEESRSQRLAMRIAELSEEVLNGR